MSDGIVAMDTAVVTRDDWHEQDSLAVQSA